MLVEQPAFLQGRAAVCLHGRAPADVEVASALVNFLATPLDADVFAIVASDRGTSNEGTTFARKFATFELADVPMDLAGALNKTSRLVVYHEQIDTPQDIQHANDLTLKGSWPYGRAFAGRTYFDMSNHVACDRLIRAHESATGVRYTTFAHSRLDVRYLEPLPRTVVDRWRQHAQHAQRDDDNNADVKHAHLRAIGEGVVWGADEASGVDDTLEPHRAAGLVWKPHGLDNEGILDLMSIADRRGWAALVGTRDAVSAGLPPYNVALRRQMTWQMLLDSRRTSTNLSSTAACGHGSSSAAAAAAAARAAAADANQSHGFFPEQFTAAQLRAHRVHVERGEWAYCRVEQYGGCRYWQEAKTLLRASPHAAQAALGRRVVHEPAWASVWARPLTADGHVAVVTLLNNRPSLSAPTSDGAHEASSQELDEGSAAAAATGTEKTSVAGREGCARHPTVNVVVDLATALGWPAGAYAVVREAWSRRDLGVAFERATILVDDAAVYTLRRLRAFEVRSMRRQERRRSDAAERRRQLSLRYPSLVPAGAQMLDTRRAVRALPPRRDVYNESGW